MKLARPVSKWLFEDLPRFNGEMVKGIRIPRREPGQKKQRPEDERAAAFDFA
jgi:hypothetical protein